MATEIYTPPQQTPVASKTYSPPYDATGTTTYQDPNKVLFVGDMLFVGYPPTVA